MFLLAVMTITRKIVLPLIFLLMYRLNGGDGFPDLRSEQCNRYPTAFAIKSLSQLYSNSFDELGTFCHFAMILGHKWPNIQRREGRVFGDPSPGWCSLVTDLAGSNYSDKADRKTL